MGGDDKSPHPIPAQADGDPSHPAKHPRTSRAHKRKLLVLLRFHGNPQIGKRKRDMRRGHLSRAPTIPPRTSTGHEAVRSLIQLPWARRMVAGERASPMVHPPKKPHAFIFNWSRAGFEGIPPEEGMNRQSPGIHSYQWELKGDGQTARTAQTPSPARLSQAFKAHGALQGPAGWLLRSSLRTRTRIDAPQGSSLQPRDLPSPHPTVFLHAVGLGSLEEPGR